MDYLAQVTLRCDPNGVHARPSAALAEAIRDRDVSVEFRRNANSVQIRPDLAMIDIMQAAVDLALESGSTFEVRCSGPQAREVFEALRLRFSTGYFEGSAFTPMETPEETDHA